MYNFCEQNSRAETPIDLHFLMPDSAAEKFDEMREYFKEKATLHLCRPLGEYGTKLSAHLASDKAFHPEFSSNYKLPMQYYYGLLEAEERVGGAFDFIEVPDIGGWGHAILAAKRAGLAFRNSHIVCRLHSSLGLITQNEPYQHQPSTWFSAMLGLERDVILGADLVIGHLPAIVDENAAHYNAGKIWRDSVKIETPPILLDTSAHSSSQNIPEPDFVFSSRIQHFKRPELFVRAAVMFLEHNPNYSGKFRVLSYGWDRELIDFIEQIPPASMRDRILFQYGYTTQERDEIISSSIVVIPSVYESLCLFAYESSLMNRPVILAQDCVAFSQADCWKDEENCLFFDGTFIDLAKIMKRAITWSPSATVKIEADLPYWHSSPPAQVVPDNPKINLKKAPALYYGINDRIELNRRLIEHQTSCFVDNPAYFFVPSHIANKENGISENLIRIISYSGHLQSAVELQHQISELNTDFVFLIGPDTHPTPFFLDSAQAALNETPTLDLFTGHALNFDPIQKIEHGVTLSTGSSLGMAILENTVASEAALIATRAINRIGFEDEARNFWYSVFCRKLTLSQGRVVIAPEILSEVDALSNMRSNSKKITGSIIDFVGLQHHFPVRMLGLDLRTTNKHIDRPTNQIISDADFLTATHVWPQPNPKNYALVAYEPDKGGLLTHPIVDNITIAKLSKLSISNIHSVKLTLRNASDKNAGVFFKLVLARHNLSSEELATLASGGNGPYIQTKWIGISSIGDETAILPLNVQVESQIYLLARLPDNIRSEDYGWAIWRQITFFG